METVATSVGAVRWLAVIVWGAQLLVLWLIGEFACPSDARWILYAINAAAVAAGIAGLAGTWRRARATPDDEPARFLDDLSLLLSGVFVLAIITTAVFVSLLPCA